ncbi:MULTISPECIES: class I SAM-dependent methyltransferase [unclassified Nocardia]|uniref:class I SAM-dependent methyltransferase n=1 Tax=unclassified Nocardia TaxID=2637762 RepID=UPI001CE4AFB5|nr:MULTISPECIES: class I SAM-dependent methyltransferase [unclassified Nocardia]
MDFDTPGKMYWNNSYVLSSQPNLWGDPPVPFVESAIDIFAADSARTVLDLPCGDGRNILPLASKFEMVVGADSAGNALDITARRAKAAEFDNILLLRSDIYDTGFEDAMFDGIFCCDVLGHLQEPEKAVRELLRICRPGRRVMANIFALEDSTRGDRMRPVGDEEYIFDDRFYFHFYSEAAARELCAKFADDAELDSIERVSWMEPPHEGYREYEHEHTSWLFVLRRR